MALGLILDESLLNEGFFLQGTTIKYNDGIQSSTVLLDDPSTIEDVVLQNDNSCSVDTLTKTLEFLGVGEDKWFLNHDQYVEIVRTDDYKRISTNMGNEGGSSNTSSLYGSISNWESIDKPTLYAKLHDIKFDYQVILSELAQLVERYSRFNRLYEVMEFNFSSRIQVQNINQLGKVLIGSIQWVEDITFDVRQEVFHFSPTLSSNEDIIVETENFFIYRMKKFVDSSFDIIYEAIPKEGIPVVEYRINKLIKLLNDD